MAKKRIPTIEELRQYRKEKDEYLRHCIENKETFVISGPKFQGENIWIAESTLPLMEAAEEVGTPKEEIWELCSKIASAVHAPITKKEYERMKPFSERPATVDAVLRFLEVNVPIYDEESRDLKFDIIAYYYCCALISLSNYRQDDCEQQLWKIVKYFIEKDKHKGDILLRNMENLEPTRPFLKPMREALEKRTQA